MKRSLKITLGSIVGIIVIAGIALAANGDLLQGRLSRNSRILPAYDETKVERNENSKTQKIIDFSNDYFEEISIPKIELCSDFKDNDDDGFIDCYDSDCSGSYTDVAKDSLVPFYFNCVRYQNASTYKADPGVYDLKLNDRLKFSNGLIAQIVDLELDQAGNPNLEIMFYVEEDGEMIIKNVRDGIYLKDPYVTMSGAYMYVESFKNFSNVNSSTWRVSIEVFDNCTDLYDICMDDPNIAFMGEDRCSFGQVVCPYEAAISGYDKLDYGMYHVIYPSHMEDVAEGTLYKMNSCYDYYRDVFGANPLLIDFYVYYYEASTELDVAASAQSDYVFSPYKSYHDNPDFELFGDGGDCDFHYFPMGHEFAHVFDNLTPNGVSKITVEGLANYLSRSNDTFHSETVCEEDGYYYISGGGTEWEDTMSFVNYEMDESSVYVRGECFWQLLEKKFGKDAVDSIVEKNFSLSGVPGYYNFLDDLIAPYVDDIWYVEEIADKLGIEKINCDFATPPLGYYDCL